ncbi:16S rRNA (cytidine(1402)-2'-O)-methyltransferase [Fictibacillus phosphorivorans]|uniref:16S rRNA (cytidine(1402)-2'-O)-methyltransferase n=1 Tax=Fictibacillus phosphorivorans TaxID=1221500 RepID=UPI002040AFA8|nr:16S rRNA (cytidine(1402)-2'-O)-methyltransferase [Fictibacillus phosphorivorans]MCM3719894.1 16S rRNA (cytidine(1402)-2'-O)-methyltransferase [Fictibacillus phosphorivorans]MCM3777584.1 16S rRNA (cytidine(1402)-2'-O)-methyltransferase [Fictibacillus phosphorivorans]
MWQQKSYHDERGTGALYLVPTPIGNLEDMTFRAVRTLKEADLIAAEDTRQTKKLCSHFEISTPLTSYHDHNKMQSGKKLIESLREGKQIALVTDAGMPGISDPGYELVVQCVEEEIPVIPLPGANAALPALVASGLDTELFTFYGFLPRGKKEKKAELERLKAFPSTLLFYEAPHRLKETLQVMENILEDRKIAVVRELTKKYEEITRGTLKEVNDFINQGDAEIRGEFCLVVEGSGDIEYLSDQTEQWWESLSVTEHVDHYVKQGEKPKEAIKLAAVDRNVPKRSVYQEYHGL